MALSDKQKTKLDDIQRTLQTVQALLVPPYPGVLTVAGDFAGGWTVRPDVQRAVKEIADVLAEG